MVKLYKNSILMICLFSICIYLTGCGTDNSNELPKLKEYIQVASIKEINKNQYEVRYKLKKDLETGNGLTTQNLYFNNGKKNISLISKKSGEQKIIIKGNTIDLIYNGSNKYFEKNKLF